MYKLIKSFGVEVSIKKIDDEIFIPFDPANTDYQAFTLWLEAGNILIPADDNGVENGEAAE